ncbi:MAG: DJ-1/PfpI family protein [Bacillaceae bacterium]|nr:DJ-1/PfpI family protein [Bacillaceae bacterium]
MRKQWKVGILIYDHADLLDISGPTEVFSLTAYSKLQQNVMLFKKKLPANRPFQVYTISEDGNPIKTHSGVTIQPDFSFENAPLFDILIIPGAALSAVQEVSSKPGVIHFIKKQQRVTFLCSVCSGAYILAKTGLLKGKKATSHHLLLPILKKKFKQVNWEHQRVVQVEHVITSGGVASGIHMALFIVKQLLGKKNAKRTAKVMEFKQ